MSLDKRSIELGDGQWAVKEDKLFAFRRDRDKFFERSFDFSRASEGTIINSDGYIQYSGLGDELVTNGGFDTDSGWYKEPSVTIENGKANFNNTPAYLVALKQLSINGVTVNNIYKLTFDLTVESGNIALYLANPPAISSVFTESGTYTVYFKATQNELRFRAIDLGFTGSVDNVSLKEVEQETPRISYDIVDGVVSDKPHLLLEPQRTNGFYNSQDAWSFNYSSNVDFTSNYSISPDGEKNAINVVPNTSNANHQFASSDRSIQYTANDVLTYSIFIKPNGYNYALIGGFFGNEGAVFNLSNGSVISEQTNVISTKSENYGNGWYRYSITYTFQNDIGNGYTYTGLKIYEDESLSAFAGDGVKSVLAFGIQIEQGPYSTSYMPSYGPFGTTVTRTAETANNSGNVGDFNNDEGVLFAEILGMGDNQHPSNIFNFVSINNGLNNTNIVAIGYREDTRKFFIVVRGGNTTSFVEQNLDFEFNKYYRIALKYKSGNNSIFINGDKINDYTGTFSITGLTKLSFDYGGVDYTPEGLKTKQIKVYTETLSDAELRLLTKYAPKDYDVAFTADYVDTVAEINILRTEATDKLYYVISDGANEVSGSATITATEVTISNIDISSLNDGTLTVSVYIEDERKQRGVTVTDTTIKDTINTPLYSYALQQRATGAVIEELDNAEAIIESLNVEV